MGRLVRVMFGVSSIVVMAVAMIVVGKPIVDRRTLALNPTATNVALSTAAPSPSSSPRPVTPPTVVPGPPATAFANTATTPTTTGVWITLSPDSGPPGTTLAIRGFIPGGPVAATARTSIQNGQYAEPQFGTICWASCADGLVEGAAQVEWSATDAGHFTMRFTVPTAPWLTASGVQQLIPADYSVYVGCLLQAPLKEKSPGFVPCTRRPQATATFHLTGPVPTPCPSGTCARLGLSPTEGPPGSLVRVEGWAPLAGLATDFAKQYSLTLSSPGTTGRGSLYVGTVLQKPNGDLVGSFRVPAFSAGAAQVSPGEYTVRAEGFTTTRAGPQAIAIATVPFKVTTGPTWASLAPARPIQIQRSYPYFGEALAVDALDSRRLAYCASPGGIQVSSDNGANWTAISTAQVAQLLTSSPYEIMGLPRDTASNTGLTCSSIVLDPFHPGSFFAVFAVAKRAYGAPPQFFVGYLTSDNGRTWREAPVPEGFTVDDFGGFQVSDSSVLALYAGKRTAPNQAPSFVAEATGDGGHTWAIGQPGCPSSGPCVRWGAVPTGIGSCAMHSFVRPIEVSTDSGRTWTASRWPNGANACESSELVATSPTDVLLLAGGMLEEPYPFEMSGDGGVTWQAVTLPTLLGNDGAPDFFRGLMMLPDGSLLVHRQSDGSWELLSTASSHWCPIVGPPLPTTWSASQSVQVIGDRLWWLPDGNPPRSVPVATIHCG